MISADEQDQLFTRLSKWERVCMVPSTDDINRFIATDVEVGRLLDELLEHFSDGPGNRLARLAHTPISWFVNPESAESFTRLRLIRLRELLGLPQGFDTRKLLRARLKAVEQDLRRQRELDEANAVLERVRLNEESRRFEAERRRREQELRAEVFKIFESQFLTATAVSIKRRFPSVGTAHVEEWRNQFVRQWFSQRKLPSPDAEQSAAIASVSSHTLLIARAGSGKTRTLVNRAIFLIKHCGVAPSELLLLAFNKKAAAEIRTRMEKLGCQCPHVMTFHALAYALVHPEEDIIYDDPKGGSQAQSGVLQKVINDLLSDSNWYDKVRQLMLDHFRTDWQSLVERGLNRTVADGLEFRRSLVSESLRGEYLKSYGEKVIANFLFEHGIPYRYEGNHWWNGRNYRPDFTLEGLNVVIEYFGMEGDPDYDKEAQKKRAYWANRPEWKLLEYSPKLLRGRGASGLTAALEADLKQLEIPLSQLSEDDIWRQIKDRLITRFASVMKNFVSRCRKSGISREGLSDKFRRHESHDDLERRFLDLANEVFTSYLDRMTNEGDEDFDGLLERAAELIDGGSMMFDRSSGSGDLGRIRVLMVDEFQDFSPLFFRILSAIQSRNRELQLFCVGDDWQAINAFAGSDLKYFNDFASMWTPTSKVNITTNHRSAVKVVSVGNRIMAGRGAPAKAADQAKAGRVILADLSELSPAAEERNVWGHDQITPAVRRAIRDPLLQGKSIALLARGEKVPYFVSGRASTAGGRPGLEELYRLWTVGLSKQEKEQVSISTVHSFKGLEADVVVVLDGIARSYPLIHPDWVFTRVFGDSIEKIVDDERRLFYVACTRAIETLIVFTEAGNESEFVKAIRPECELLQWSQYPPFAPDKGEWIVKVGSQDGKGSDPTFQRKDALKAHGFTFHRGDWPHWARVFSGSMDLAGLVQELRGPTWVRGPDGLEIRICRGGGDVVERYVVQEGELRRCQ